MDIKEFYTNNKKIDEWIDSHLQAEIKKRELDRIDIEHVIDFLKSDYCPKRITRLGYNAATKLAKEWVEKVNKKATIDECDEDIEVILENENYKWVKLKSSQSYSREGKLMGHCVASYVKSKSSIYSLRDSLNMPHCTIEILNTKVKQIKGKQNRFVIGKYHKEVIRFINEIEATLDTYDLKNIGALFIDKKLCYVEDIPEKAIIEPIEIGDKNDRYKNVLNKTVYFSGFSRLPKELVVKSSMLIDNPENNKEYDLCKWDILGDLHLSNVNIKLPKIKILNNEKQNVTLVKSNVIGSDIEVTSLSTKNTSLSIDDLICHDLELSGGSFEYNNCLNIKNEVVISELDKPIIFKNTLDINCLKIHDCDVEIRDKIYCDVLVLDNVRISQESLDNIIPRSGVTIQGNMNIDEFPSWDLPCHLDIREVGSVNKFRPGLKTELLFAKESMKKKLKEASIDYENPNEIKEVFFIN